MHEQKVSLDIYTVLAQMGIDTEKWEACCRQAREGQGDHGCDHDNEEPL
ncbi:hypothetical protein [Xylanibacillus composti]|uniref:Uncharacterized protein n=1 Tax=Xylanibacillus composti TaxID=1572762 RepID=A0A8J4H4Z6_9BACL|nr:hypothetical protein [Xylanibacillus composti]GIQ69760.1 hypothetical protein XYCOK13_25840 [Xylanibacillus composti]